MSVKNNLDNDAYRVTYPSSRDFNSQDDYRIAISNFKQQEAEQTLKFREDLESEYGLSEHPKRNVLWHLAWEHGHSSGLWNVYSWYDELSELLT